jgi:hypothetical protein
LRKEAGIATKAPTCLPAERSDGMACQQAGLAGRNTKVHKKYSVLFCVSVFLPAAGRFVAKKRLRLSAATKNNRLF